MVLLPGCECCRGDACVELAARFIAATSLEIDVSATDYELTRTERVVRLTSYDEAPCGKYGIGSLGIAFQIFKGSQINGTYSIPLISDVVNYFSGLRERFYEYTVSDIPICSAQIQITVYLGRKLISVNPVTFEYFLDNISVRVAVGYATGVQRAGTSIPEFLSCSKSSTCGTNNNNEQGGSYSHRLSGFHESFSSFLCNSSFDLSSVANSAFSSPTLTNSTSLPYVFGRTNNTENNNNCGEWVTGPASASATVGFSNLIIP